MYLESKSKINRACSKSRPARSAFSLLEMLLVVSLLTLIVLGLYSMFNQAQRALRGNTAQVDVLEAGRATVSLVGQDLEHCTPAGLPRGTNLYTAVTFPNPVFFHPVLQNLMTTNRQELRTNVIQECFFLSRFQNTWLGLGYFVASATNPAVGVGADGVGTLYRFVEPVQPPSPLVTTNQLLNLHRHFAARTNANPLADGIIHLRFQAYDRRGYAMVYKDRNFGIPIPDPAYQILYLRRSNQRVASQPALVTTNVILREAFVSTECFFLSNAAPAFLQMELGLLDPHTWERVKSMPFSAAKGQYLQRQVGAVHLFHKMVPLRNTQP